MPAGRPESGGSGGAAPGAAGRTTFRPPWVRDGPKPIPMPTAPWALAHRNKEPANRNTETDNTLPSSDGPPARKTSSIKITPLQPAENGTIRDPHTFERPKLREVPKAPPKEPTRLQSREVKVPVAIARKEPKELPIQVHIESKKTEPPQAVPKQDVQLVKREAPRNEASRDGPREVDRSEVPVREVPVKREVPIKREALEERSAKVWEENDDIEKATPAQRNAIVRQDTSRKLSDMPVPPPLPPPPPPVPKSLLVSKELLTREKKEKIDTLKSRPRKRPDWAAMMKELEVGKKLKHVQCNDRSQPLLPQNKTKGQFIYESEKSNMHNQLLRQIQTGKSLKHVKTNDRSKPILEGLRKFRRQMTIEEQIIKSQSMANMPEADVEEEADEMDDIDKVRDDLQSTKQMLALELRNKEAQIRENKRLQARLLNLEAELEKERALLKSQQQSGDIQVTAADEKVLNSLKEEANEARKTAEDLEKKFHTTADQLDCVKGDLDEAKRQNQLLEKKLQALQGGGLKRQSVSDRRESVPGKEPEPPESEEESITESESESEEEDNEAKQQRRLEREVRLLRNKLRSYKNKEEAAKRERKSLRDQMKKNQHAMKQEKKKYRDLQKEVNKMAALMKDDEEDEEKEEEEEEEETESEESETESESETSEEEESSGSEAEGDTPSEKHKETLQNRSKRHENCLNALKKGNYMLKANVDRLQDDLNKQKEMGISLQEDLDSVLAELG